MASEGPHASPSVEAGREAGRVVDHLGRLGLCITRIEDPFFCEGKVPLKNSTTLELKPKAPAHGDSGAALSSTASKASAKVASMKLVVPESVYTPIHPERQAELKKSRFSDELVEETIRASLMTENFAKLLEEVFEPSPFGHGGNTVLDHSVRKAMQVKADRIVSTGIDLEELGILESVRRGLAPNASRIHASLDKLNLYSKGGHFKSHRDTPRDELAFGTLVISLPSTFRGGNLVVHHRDSTHTCRWETELKRKLYTSGEIQYAERFQPPQNALQWCAFFGHCHHKIEKIKEGHRLTLTYILRYDPADKGIADQMREDMGAAAAPLVPSAGDDYEQEEEDDDDSDDSNEGEDEEEEDDDEEDDVEFEFEEIEETVSSMSVAQLKAACRTLGLRVSGTKAILSSRILDHYAAKLKAKGKSPSPSSTSTGKPGLPDKGTYPTSLAAQLGSNLHQELREALEDPDFLSDGGMVGVPCMHLYEQDADLPPLDEELLGGKFDPEKAIEAASGNLPESSKGKKGKREGRAGAGGGGGVDVSEKAESIRARDLRLKGADALVYTCATRLGLRPMVLRIVWSNEYGKYSLKELPSLQTAYDWCSVNLIEDSFVARTFSTEGTIGDITSGEGAGPFQGHSGGGGWGSEPGLDTDEVSWVFTPPFEGGKTPPAATVLQDIFTSHTDYFGNEASIDTYYAAAAIVFVVPAADSPGREALIAHASRRFGQLAGAKGRGPSPRKKLKGEDTGSNPLSPKEPKDAAAAGQGRSEQEGQEQEELEAVFSGLRRGIDPSKEEEAWSKYAQAWRKGKPDVSRAEAIDLAQAYGVSTSGSTSASLNRVGRAAERSRFKEMDDMFGVGGMF